MEYERRIGLSPLKFARQISHRSKEHCRVSIHDILPMLGGMPLSLNWAPAGWSHAGMRGPAMAAITETSLWIHLAVAVATKQPLARVNEIQVKSSGRLADDSKTPIF